MSTKSQPLFDVEKSIRESQKRNERVCWYALNVTPNHEFRLWEYYTGKQFPYRRHTVRKDANGKKLPPIKMDPVIEAFVPYRLQKRVWSDRVKTIPVVQSPGMIFVRMAMKNRDKIFYDHYVQSFVYDKARRFLTIIPDDEMNSFIKVVEDSEDSYITTPIAGNKVQIIRGKFEGLVGEVIRNDGKLRFQIRVTSLIAVSMSIAAEDIVVVPEYTESILPDISYNQIK